mmetsp:Transcript_8485/g.13418  ORF Transcript_8485/g.13418 Transcript_8485/m.13418 type:complete len:95 (-) Transcript_8485:81-365(-)
MEVLDPRNTTSPLLQTAAPVPVSMQVIFFEELKAVRISFGAMPPEIAFLGKVAPLNAARLVTPVASERSPCMCITVSTAAAMAMAAKIAFLIIG